ncbi:MAG: hypothetical protein WB676_16670 [Bryobacteraceae bacterium]
MQTGHQKSTGDTFPADVANYHRHPIYTEIDEIVVIATHLAGL